MKKLFASYVTNDSSPVFVLQKLPEVVKGALFSRYSRSSLGLRELLESEFLSTEELGEEKATEFYNRILDAYGDDSIGELGGAHLAMESISMLAAKEVQDARIGGSPLEKSTRYVPFDKKIDGAFPYYKEPSILASDYREEYIRFCDSLFETYRTLIPKVTQRLEKLHPKGETAQEGAYRSALRSAVFDLLRGILPAATLTNMGCFGNGRFFESLLTKMHVSPFFEVRELGKRAGEELSKVIAPFIRRAETSHPYCKAHHRYWENLDACRLYAKKRTLLTPTKEPEKILCDRVPSVCLVRSPSLEEVRHLLVAFLYKEMDLRYEEIQQKVALLEEESLFELFFELSEPRENRRHKSPRALEHLEYTFEIEVDFGAFRDLQRHRLLTQERQLFTPYLGYYLPEELRGGEEEELYRGAMERASEFYERLSIDFPLEAQYIVPMAFYVRWCVRANLRSLQWLTELRSIQQGHSQYRKVAQLMSQAIGEAHPMLRSVFKFVDQKEAPLGRYFQEEKRIKKEQP